MSKDEILVPILNAINDLRLEVRENRKAIEENRKAIEENKKSIESLNTRFERFERENKKDHKEIYRILDTFKNVSSVVQVTKMN